MVRLLDFTFWLNLFNLFHTTLFNIAYVYKGLPVTHIYKLFSVNHQIDALHILTNHRGRWYTASLQHPHWLNTSSQNTLHIKISAHPFSEIRLLWEIAFIIFNNFNKWSYYIRAFESSQTIADHKLACRRTCSTWLHPRNQNVHLADYLYKLQ